MASLRITIAKIGGAAGGAVMSRFHYWAGLRLIDVPSEWGPNQWPAPARKEMDAFASALRSNGHKPPVVDFSGHVDSWSMGDLFRRYLPSSDRHELIELHSNRWQLCCYPLPDNGTLSQSLRHSSRLKRIRERHAQEDRWFATHLLEATLAWEGVADHGAIVLLRQIFGGLVEDSEIEKSLAKVPGWIADRSTLSENVQVLGDIDGEST
jgi:hypothetical protein